MNRETSGHIVKTQHRGLRSISQLIVCAICGCPLGAHPMDTI